MESGGGTKPVRTPRWEGHLIAGTGRSRHKREGSTVRDRRQCRSMGSKCFSFQLGGISPSPFGEGLCDLIVVDQLDQYVHQIARKLTASPVGSKKGFGLDVGLARFASAQIDDQITDVIRRGEASRAQ